MKSNYFSYYKLSDKYELIISVRLRNLILNLRYYKFSKKIKVNFYRILWPIDMDVVTMWKQISWRS